MLMHVTHCVRCWCPNSLTWSLFIVWFIKASWIKTHRVNISMTFHFTLKSFTSAFLNVIWINDLNVSSVVSELNKVLFFLKCAFHDTMCPPPPKKTPNKNKQIFIYSVYLLGFGKYICRWQSYIHQTNYVVPYGSLQNGNQHESPALNAGTGNPSEGEAAWPPTPVKDFSCLEGCYWVFRRCSPALYQKPTFHQRLKSGNRAESLETAFLDQPSHLSF